MTLALYRKYRPRTFAEVIGQEHVTEPLSQALRSGRLHHAYLFSGPRGCGKTSSARILARSLNCERGPTPEPCGVCGSCKSLANDGAGSIDVIEIDAASHGGVDDARDLREKAFFAPASSRFKIYVIDEAHMVSSAGFNALLKLVEEPPEYVKFIFATTEPEKVLATIKSRTHHYPFRLIPPAVLRPYLQQLTEAEGIHVEPAVFPLVVKAGGGSARDTLSVLDQLISGAGPEGVTYPRAVSLLGVTDVALIDEMCDALAAGDGATAYSTIDRVAEAGHDARRFASDLLERFRDLIVLQQVPDAVAKGLIDGPADQLDAMSAQATRLGPATLSRCADIVHNGLVEMRGTTAPRLLLELITARMLLPGADDSAGALLQRLERMERRLTLSDSSGGSSSTVAARPIDSGGDPGGGSPAATSGPDGGGLSAARAAAAAAARRGPVPGPVAESTVSAVPPTESGEAAADAPDWSDVAGTDDLPPEPDYDEDEHPAIEPPSAMPEAGPAGLRAEPLPARPEPEREPARPASLSLEPAVAEPVGPELVAVPEPAAVSVAVPESAAVPVRAEPAGVLPDAPEEPDEVEAAAAAPGQLSAASIREVWPEIVTAVGRQSKKIAALASGATVRDLDGQTVLLTFRFPAHARMVSAEPEMLSNALYEALGGRWQIRCDVAGDGAAEPAPVRRAAPAQGGPAQGGPAQGGPAQGGPAQGGPAQGGGSVPDQGGSGQRGPAAGGHRTPAQNAPATRQREAASPARASAGVPAADDDDWPEPAKPGGRASTAASPSPVDSGRDDADRAAGTGGATAAATRPDPATTPVPHVSAMNAPVADAPVTNVPANVPAVNAPVATVPAVNAPVVNAPAAGVPVSAPVAGVPALRAPAANAPVVSAPVDSPARANPAPSRPADPAPAGAPSVPVRPVSAAVAAARAAAANAGRGGSGAAGTTAAPDSSAAAGTGGAAVAQPSTTAGARGGASSGTGSDGWADGSGAEEPPYDPDYDGPAPGIEGFDPGDEPLDDVIDEKTARQSSEQQAMQLLKEAFGAEKIGEV